MLDQIWCGAGAAILDADVCTRTSVTRFAKPPRRLDCALINGLSTHTTAFSFYHTSPYT